MRRCAREESAMSMWPAPQPPISSGDVDMEEEALAEPESKLTLGIAPSALAQGRSSIHLLVGGACIAAARREKQPEIIDLFDSDDEQDRPRQRAYTAGQGGLHPNGVGGQPTSNRPSGQVKPMVVRARVSKPSVATNQHPSAAGGNGGGESYGGSAGAVRAFVAEAVSCVARAEANVLRLEAEEASLVDTVERLGGILRVTKHDLASAEVRLNEFKGNLASRDADQANGQAAHASTSDNGAGSGGAVNGNGVGSKNRSRTINSEGTCSGINGNTNGSGGLGTSTASSSQPAKKPRHRPPVPLFSEAMAQTPRNTKGVGDNTRGAATSTSTSCVSASPGSSVASPSMAKTPTDPRASGQGEGERVAYQKAIFTALDVDGDRRLNWKEMRHFAELVGFDEDDEAWKAAFEDLCEVVAAPPTEGLDETGFLAVLDDDDRGCYCKTAELRRILSKLHPLAPRQARLAKARAVAAAAAVAAATTSAASSFAAADDVSASPSPCTSSCSIAVEEAPHADTPAVAELAAESSLADLTARETPSAAAPASEEAPHAETVAIAPMAVEASPAELTELEILCAAPLASDEASLDETPAAGVTSAAAADSEVIAASSPGNADSAAAPDITSDSSPSTSESVTGLAVEATQIDEVPAAAMAGESSSRPGNVVETTSMSDEEAVEENIVTTDGYEGLTV
eukprot:TRINITY_DN43645_c0_g1_i1.p1 TRINITY_DN43645_c0_g1~~TRINITY_DN43645_c0_g1_i1.p1  ORF type:complete len:686 (+),score=151.53 TRINITY_DN43645_c0_g1_i1:87-2144(+)